MALVLPRGTDEFVLFVPSSASNLELIHISISETDIFDLTKEIAGPLSSFQGMIGDPFPLRRKPDMGYKCRRDSSDILLERQKFSLKITD